MPIATLTLTNDSDTPTVVDATLNTWHQIHDEDIYTPIKELLIVPPLVTIPAHGSQLLRIALRTPVSNTSEIPYRLYLKEVLPPAHSKILALRVALRLGLPVFIEPPIKTQVKLDWSIKKNKNSEWLIKAKNIGNQHVQIGELILSQNGKTLFEKSMAEYILPSSTYVWHIDRKQLNISNHGSVTIIAKTSENELTTHIKL